MRSRSNDPSRSKYPPARPPPQGHRDHFVTSGTSVAPVRSITIEYARRCRRTHIQGSVMNRCVRLALNAGTWLSLLGAAEAQTQTFPLESTDRLELHSVTA